MRSFSEIGTDTGSLVEDKNRAYGSSFSTAGDALRLLYPNGIRSEQMHDALLVARIWDKLMRIATDRDALGESPYQDIAGYGILGVHMHQQRKEGPGTCDGSVSDAAHQSKELHAASAKTDVSEPTITRESEKRAPYSNALSKLRSLSGYERMAAPAPTAMVDVSAAAAVLERTRARNEHGLCAQCELDLSSVEPFGGRLRVGHLSAVFLTCGPLCARTLLIEYNQARGERNA